MADFRQASRQSWTSVDSVEHINAGSLQRIADATEKMAQRHTELIEQRDRYSRWLSDETDRRKSLERQLSASRGVITKLRKQLAEARAAAAMGDRNA